MPIKLKRSNFIKVKEDFFCENCNFEVHGNGYTNHCPHCLCSKHVDQDIPGDRLSTCRGLMLPIDYFSKNGTTYLVHKCSICDKISNNKMNSDDLISALLELKV